MHGNPFDFDTVIDRSGTISQKWERYAGRDVLPMWVADMDFKSPQPVIDALQERVAHGVFGYTIPDPGVTAETAAEFSRRYGYAVDPDWLVWLPGVNVGMNLACRAIGEPGDAALTLTPIYPPFFTSSPNSERRLHRVPLLRTESGRYEIDFHALRRIDDPRLRILLLCSPHNPVGRVWTEPELRALVEFAVERDLTIVSDEIHCDLVLEGRHIATASLGAEVARRTITVVAPSKTYNIPGLTCALAIIPDPDLRRRFNSGKRGLVPDYNILGMWATRAAYLHGEPWRLALIDYLRANRDHLARRLAAEAPELRMTPLEATYLAWLDARSLGLDAPAAHFERHGVGLNEGATFGTPGFVRLNFGCPRSTLDRGIDRLIAGVRAAV
jgi:cystathionine beta-lyase